MNSPRSQDLQVWTPALTIHSDVLCTCTGPHRSESICTVYLTRASQQVCEAEHITSSILRLKEPGSIRAKIKSTTSYRGCCMPTHQAATAGQSGARATRKNEPAGGARSWSAAAEPGASGS